VKVEWASAKSGFFENFSNSKLLETTNSGDLSFKRRPPELFFYSRLY